MLHLTVSFVPAETSLFPRAHFPDYLNCAMANETSLFPRAHFLYLSYASVLSL